MHDSQDDRNLAEVVADMDPLVSDLQKWAKAFLMISMTERAEVDGEAIYVMAKALGERTDELKAQWNRAFKLSRPPK